LGVVSLAAKLVLSSGGSAGDAVVSSDFALPEFTSPVSGGVLVGADPVSSSSTPPASPSVTSAVTSTGPISSGFVFEGADGEVSMGAFDTAPVIAIGTVPDSIDFFFQTQIVSSGAELLIAGEDTNTIVVDAGGKLTIESGGRLETFGVEDSSVWGSLDVAAGGVASWLFVESGAVGRIESGGRIVDSYIYGGSLDVAAGGVAFGANFHYGAAGKVESGGLINGAVLQDSTLEIMSGGIMGAGTTTFWGSASLMLDDAPAFSGTVSSFDATDKIDLGNIAFSGATLAYSASGTSGTLTVNDGAHVAALALVGQYTAANFQLADDGHGGTVVTEHPVSSGAPLGSPH
jgi:hypothetical protein